MNPERTFKTLAVTSLVLSLVFAFALVWDLSGGGRGGGASSQVATGMAGEEGTAGAEQGAGTGAGASGQGSAEGPGRLPTLGPVKRGQAEEKTGITGGSIKLGAIFSETGAFDARPAEYSVRAYFQAVNEQGGIYGKKLELAVCDDGGDATRGDQCARQLVEREKVFAIVGWLAPFSEPRAARYFHQQGVPVIGGLGVPEEFESPLSFPTMANLAQAGLGVAIYLCEMSAKEGWKKSAGVVADLPFMLQAVDGAIRGLKQQCNATPARVDKVSTANPSYDSLVIQWKFDGIDSIVAAMDPMSYVRMFQAMQRQGYHPHVVVIGGASEEHNRQVAEALKGAVTVESELVPRAHPGHPGGERYVKTLHRYYPGVTVASDAEISWTAAQVFVEGLKRAGPDLTREKLVAALNTLREFKTDLTAPLTYTPENHDAVTCVELLQWDGARWRFYPGYEAWQCWSYLPGYSGARRAPSRPFS